MTAKERNTIKLLEYLGDPNNKILTKTELALTVLGYKRMESLYNCFTVDELSEIETQALELRRKRYSPQLMEIDKALIKAAKGGDSHAIKLCYQRFEGWTEKKMVELGLDKETAKHVYGHLDKKGK